MDGGDKKRALSGSDRQQKYKDENKEKVKLNEMKQNFAKSKLNETDPEKAERIKEAARKRKAEQRKREKESSKENKDPETVETLDTDTTPQKKARRESGLPDIDLGCEGGAGVRMSRRSSGDLSDVSLASEDSSFLEPSPSRQYTFGVKQRKKNVAEKNKIVKDLEEEIKDLKNAQDKHDDIVTELDFKVRELEIKDVKSQQRIKELEEKLKENTDIWFAELYKHVTPFGRRDI